MATHMGDVAANSWLDAEFRGTTYAIPAACYAYLYTVECDDAGAGGTELVLAGYTPANVRTQFGSAPAGRQATNTAIISFGTPSAVYAGLPAIYLVFRSAAAGGGTYRFKMKLQNPVAPVNGVALEIGIGSLAPNIQ